MAGWIKLWRKLKDNGHLKMPGAAFKLWIYCLLEAAPYPDKERDLAAGELWLSYEHVRQAIGEAGRQMSKSTVSAALKYLVQNGYLEMQARQFYGVKAKVANWQNYQGYAENTPARVQKSYPSSTETVPAGVPVTVPVGVLVKDPGPYCSNASSVPKNIENKENKDLYVDADVDANANSNANSNVNSNVNSNPNLYSNADAVTTVLASEFKREFGRPLSPIEIKQLARWQQIFSADLIQEALSRACLQDKRTVAYIGGILKNWSRAGITTVEEARREQTRPNPKGGKRNARGKPGYRPGEIDWTKEPDTL